MSLGDDLKKDVAKIFREQWTTRDGQKVPDADDVQLGNHAVKLDGTVLYADLAGSTKLVDKYKPEFAAKIYKTYLHCAAKIIRSDGGEITAYDGDRIMAVYIGKSKSTSAVRSGLKINYAAKKIVNPALKNQYPGETYEVKQVVGIDTCKLFIARTGIRGSNDLVWVGRAANYAAKLTEMSSDYPTRITTDIYKNMHDSVTKTDGKPMWEAVRWTDMNDILVYRSSWIQSL
jgi:class 3 adenylate cyclase